MLKGRWAFRDLIQKRGLDIVQPDISIAGGFTECRKIAAHGERKLRPRSSPTCGAVVSASRQHFTGKPRFQMRRRHSIQSLPSWNFDMTENRLRTALAQEPIQAVDGYVDVPQAPGLGIEIDRDVLEQYA